MVGSSETPPPADPERRTVLKGSLAAFFGMLSLSRCSQGDAGSLEAAGIGPRAKGERTGARDEPLDLLGFTSISPSTDDRIRVPDGYEFEVLYAWGDPIRGPHRVGDGFKVSDLLEEELGGGPEGDRGTTDYAGMHHDGMEFFALTPEECAGGYDEEGLLAINHEFIDTGLLFADADRRWTKRKERVSKAAHGVSVIHVGCKQGRWELVDSDRAFRVTASTPIEVSGPAREFLGESVIGTVANCSAGRTPWGTYLSCEENFQELFAVADPSFQPSALELIYGLNLPGPGPYHWVRTDPEYRLDQNRRRPLQFGWVVEMDPRRPDKKPVKRTALGRFRHENAAFTLSRDRRVVVYQGDDTAGECLYKFVSDRAYDGKEHEGLLDEGTLYVAKFEGSGDEARGRWLPLDRGRDPRLANVFRSQAEVLIGARGAARVVGATDLDRPEWCALRGAGEDRVGDGEVFVSLSNHAARTKPNGPNPRVANPHGQILHLVEDERDGAAEEFAWSLFHLAGPVHDGGTLPGDLNYSAPDGLRMDAAGRLWIQSDVSSSLIDSGPHAGQGNNQMLAADPTTGEIRRFLTGPKRCEVTGIAFTPDQRTMFVNIQHPGQPNTASSDPTLPTLSRWPHTDECADVTKVKAPPRSGTVVIRRQDGGVIGT